jgi:diaminopimelate epimerase
MSAPPNEGQQSARIPFTKASARGNDFLLVEGAHASGDLTQLTRRLCDRHRGVGADGVEWLFPDAEADVTARLINADGSEAEISGNGTRCVAAQICSHEEKTEVVVRTGAGLKTRGRRPVVD